MRMMTNVIDPGKLTKDQLFQALSDHGVQHLPAKKTRKQELVELYLKHVGSESETTTTTEPSVYNQSRTSGEEQVLLPKSAHPRENARTMPPSKRGEPPTEVQLMSNTELAAALRARGIDVGPIMATTRKVYERKLAMLLEGGSVAQASASEGEEDMEDESYEQEDYTSHDVSADPEPEIIQTSRFESREIRQRPPIRQNYNAEESVSYSKTYSSASSTSSHINEPPQTAPVAKKKGMSLIAKLLILIVLGGLVYLVVVNMDSVAPKPPSLTGDPEVGKAKAET